MGSSDERIVALLKEARHQLELERSRRTEPIAIVGIGCRLPAARGGPEGFWRLLCDGVDASREVPAERWDAERHYDPDPEAIGKAYTRRGAFLDQVDAFDAEFFGISPREALGMDPQQRLLLEVTWEALEDAGILPERLRGSATGVWVGLCVDDYARRSVTSGDFSRIDAYNTLGNTRSVAAGRISYVLDLHGPAVQLDTACSSSLVAVHQACQSLRSRECDQALVGGVNLMLAPESTIALCKLRALAPDGRCKTFDASADGYGRGEGCAMVVLRRLSDARAAGDRIYAVVRGTAVNHDGHSNGLTAPSGIAQEAVIRSALDNAGVEARNVGYVEAHGTGTLLGDPLEVLALNRVYGQERPAHEPLLLGAVKTNLGHLEGAAGVVGLIKSALCLSHAWIPASLHFKTPNPKIPWADLGVRVADQSREWPRGDRARLAAVSSFGISGTNAHVVLEEPPAVSTVPVGSARAAQLMVLSGKTPEVLSARAQELKHHLEAHPELELEEVAYNLVTTRTLHEHRWARPAASREALLQSLDELQRRGSPRSGQEGEGAIPTGKLAWLFTGQGAQRLGMGRGLYGEWSAFGDALDAACTELDPLLDHPLREVMWAREGTPLAALLDQTGFTQPALFALEWALAALWRSWGVEPDVLLGHSVGEITAATVAGVMSLPDACRLVAARARLMQALPAGGGMLSVAAAEERVREALVAAGGQLSLAAVNGPLSVVVSGPLTELSSLAERLERAGVQTKRLSVSHAFHSQLMAPMLAAFREVASRVVYQPARIPLVADTTGALAGPEISTAEYWVRHVREAVRFAPGVRALAQAGANTFLEVGPRATLLGLVATCLEGRPASLLASLRPTQNETASMLEALGSWFSAGGKVAWSGLFPQAAARVALPTYPWRQERFWLETVAPLRAALGSTTGHPLLGVRVAAASADAVYESILDVGEPAWLAHHRVGGHTVAPGAALAECLRAAAQDHAGRPQALVDLEIHAPLVLTDKSARRVQVVLTERGTKAALHSQPVAADVSAPWVLHASCQLRAASPAAAPLALVELRARCPEPVAVDAVYEALAGLGLSYGSPFRGLRSLWRAADEALAEVALPVEVAAGGYGVHPALLDAAFHAIAGLLGTPDRVLLPVGLGSFFVHRTPPGLVLAHVQLRKRVTEEVVADVTLADVSGEVLVEVVALRLRPVDASVLLRLAASTPTFHRLAWLPSQAPAAVGLSERWLIVSPREGDASALAAALRARGADALSTTLEELPAHLPAAHVLCLWQDEPASAAVAVAGAGLAVAQACARQLPAPRLWWVTKGAVSCAEEEAAPALAALWGLGRSVLREHAALSLTLLDVDGGDLSQVLAREVAAADSETQVAWRGHQRRVARVVRAGAAPKTAGDRRRLRTDGSVLISGGLGALGSEVALHFARRGVRHLILTGRRGAATPGAEELRAEIEQLGARVTLAAVDVAERDALAQVLSAIPRELPLRGVIHLAAVLDDGLLVEQTPERFAKVMAPKVTGGWNLHELTEHADLDLFLSFSSISGTLGSPGQTSYAAANAFLDALSVYRRARGQVGSSLAWGPWSGRGLAAQLEGNLQARFARQGLRMTSVADGLEILDAALLHPESQLIAAQFDLPALARSFAGAVPPLWRALVQAQAAGDTPERDWLQQLTPLPAEQRLEAIGQLLRVEIARVLAVAAPDQLPMHKPLQELGLDSLMEVELRTRLGVCTRTTLPPNLALEHPTPLAIARYLLEHVLRLESTAGEDAAGDAASLPLASNDGYVRAEPRGDVASLRADAQIADDVRGLGRPEAEPQSVFLTGSTGFLGAFLLAELCKQTTARITCLVRAETPRDGERRILENLRSYGLTDVPVEGRLEILLGDLEKPELGLTERRFRELADDVGAIYSNGVRVSFVAAYERLKLSHVNGTRQLLRLASMGRPKWLHHVSSTSAYSSAAYQNRTLGESSPPLECDDMVLPYAQCKWVTEEMARSAMARDVPVVIYRPSVIGGSSVSGVWNADDLLLRTLIGAVELGVLPGPFDSLVDFSPVDYVARALVYLSRQPSSLHRSFNLNHPVGLPWNSLAAVLRSLGYPIQFAAYDEWLQRIESTRHGALYPLLPFLKQRGADGLSYLERQERRHAATVTCVETVQALAPAGIHCPPLDVTLLTRYLSQLRSALAAQG